MASSASRKLLVLKRCLPAAWLPRRLPSRQLNQRHSSSTGTPTSTLCSIQLIALREESMVHLASLFAQKLRPGDCYCLYGEVGAGKSVFSRAFIREASQDDQLPVPSPTYLLQNMYEEHDGPAIHHFDLYRLSAESNLERIDLQSSFVGAVSLVEWANRLGTRVPTEHMAVHIAVQKDEAGIAHGNMHASRSGEVLFNRSMGDDSTAAGSDSMSDSDDQYTDLRSRIVVLEPHGVYWEQRMAEVMQQLTDDGPSHGLAAVCAK